MVSPSGVVDDIIKKGKRKGPSGIGEEGPQAVRNSFLLLDDYILQHF